MHRVDGDNGGRRSPKRVWQAADCPGPAACLLIRCPCPTMLTRYRSRSRSQLELAIPACLRPFGGPAVSDGFRRPVGFASRPCGQFALVGSEGNLTETLCPVREQSRPVDNTRVAAAQMRVWAGAATIFIHNSCYAAGQSQQSIGSKEGRKPGNRFRCSIHISYLPPYCETPLALTSWFPAFLRVCAKSAPHETGSFSSRLGNEFLAW